MHVIFDDLTEGTFLPEFSKEISQDNINRYAEASGDYNPIHLNSEFAKKVGLTGTVAHGMLVLAYVSSYFTDLFGIEWLTGGMLNVKFKESARPGDIILIKGKVIRLMKHERFTSILCDISCRNGKNEAVITGEASIDIRTHA